VESDLFGKLKVQLGDHWYRLIGTRDHVGKNGPVTMLVWEGECADCGASFEVLTKLEVGKNVKRRCPLHIHHGLPASPAANDAQRKNDHPLNQAWRRKQGRS
jgi:hypothetical protein